jgi:hypothetical protein
MTYVSELPPVRDFLAAKLHSMLISKRANKASTRSSTVLNALIRIGLHIAGFSLLTLAAWQWNMIAGLAAAGISCFAMSALTTGSDNGGGDDVRRAPDLRTGR